MFHREIKIVFICLVALMVVSSSKAEQERNPDTRGIGKRIIRGQKIAIDKVPYVVQLRDRFTGAFICGGTLVNPTHVVTAAHCIYGTVPKSYIDVVGGATTLSEPGIAVHVADSSHHKYYNENVKFTHDVAVLKLEEPLEGPNISTINLCSVDRDDDLRYYQVSGWGTTENGTLSEHLRTVRVPTIPDDECMSAYGRKYMSGTMQCASVPGDKDACQGDSGGPAVTNGELCGIVSWGWGCAHAKYPGVYTKVSTVGAFLGEALRS